MTATDPTRRGGHPAPAAELADLPKAPSGPGPGADPAAGMDMRETIGYLVFRATDRRTRAAATEPSTTTPLGVKPHA